MNVLPRRLRERVLRVQEFLEKGTLFGMDEGAREALWGQAAGLLERLDQLSDQCLVAGLLGGTGVGKSTVMNGLAGAEIASTSHRRPHTDRVLVYRHEGVEPPPVLSGTPVPWHEHLHREEAVRRILLCDLPDFDSLAGEHRERVWTFMESLDVLVFVTTPEKYGDEALYAFLRAVPKARPNFYFLLNKVDLLFEGEELEPGYRRVARLVDLFRGYLGEAGVEEPVVFPVSALEAMEKGAGVSPWNQFPAFRREIFRERDAREVRAVKTANLDREIRVLEGRVREETDRLEALGGVVRESLELLEREKEGLDGAVRRAVETWVEEQLREPVLECLETSRALVGPARVVGAIAREWKAWRAGGGKRGRPGPGGEIPPPPEALREHLARQQDRLVHQALRKGLPAAYRRRLEAGLDVERRWEGFTERWRERIEAGLRTLAAPRFVGLRLLQVLALVGLFVLLLLALVDEAALQAFMAQPGWGPCWRLAVGLVRRLFSMTGLGALLTFGLLQLLLGVFFYRRYRRRLERKARRELVRLRDELAAGWAEELRGLAEGLREFEGRIQEQRRLVPAPDASP